MTKEDAKIILKAIAADIHECCGHCYYENEPRKEDFYEALKTFGIEIEE